MLDRALLLYYNTANSAAGDQWTLNLTGSSGSADQTVTPGGQAFYNFTVNNSNSNANYDDIVLAGALDVNELKLQDGQLYGSNYAITVGGNWTNTAGDTAYVAGNETVTFDDATKTTTISGNNTFYGFACSTASKGIDFTAGTTQIITNTLTLNGQATTTCIDLNSTTPGTHWNLNAPAGASVSYVDVQDSDASGGSTIQHTDCVNSGNNHNWFGWAEGNGQTPNTTAALDAALMNWDRLSDWSNLYKKKLFYSKFIQMIEIGGMPYYIEY